MFKFRSVIAVLLALVTTLLVSCSSPTAAKPPTYTPTQLEQIQRYRTDVSALGDRLPELATLITTRRWTDVRTFIHGPLGELRIRMSKLTRTLLPNAQPRAQEIAQEVFEHLVKIDQAAENTNYELAIRNYNEAIKDLEAFFQLIPSA